MGDIKIEISASMVAWYGAVVATGAAVISGLNAWRDRARLRIQVSRDMEFVPPTPDTAGKTYWTVTISNAGRRPVTLTHVWFERARKGAAKLVLTDSLREGLVEITEGRSKAYSVDDAQVGSEDLRWVGVGTAVGKTYRWKLSNVMSRKRGAGLKGSQTLRQARSGGQGEGCE